MIIRVGNRIIEIQGALTLSITRGQSALGEITERRGEGIVVEQRKEGIGTDLTDKLIASAVLICMSAFFSRIGLYIPDVVE
jgi:hypothetical protein